MLSCIVEPCTHSCLFYSLQPVTAQFGIGKKKKQSTTFQDLQERAAAAAGGRAEHDAAEEMVDMAKLQEMFASAFENPDAMAGFGEDINKAMEELANMDPADLQKQMEQAMAAMTSGDMVENIMGQKDAVLQNLQESGMVSEEELEKFKSDPEYFERQMRDAFAQMQTMFQDPEMLKMAGETMKGMQEAFSDPAITELTKLLEGGLEDDTKIEEARLQLLQNPQILESPMFKTMFGGDEFQEILHDPVKWRETIKEGMQMMASGGGIPGVGTRPGGGARVAGHGEL